MVKKKTTDAVRTARLRVAEVSGDWSETTKRWFLLSFACTEIANTIWQTWLAWHIQNDSRRKTIAWLDLRKSAGIKEAGKSPVVALPPELSKLIRTTISERHPEVHCRVSTLLQQSIFRGILSREAAKGSLPGWTAILLCHEGLPSFTRPLPIRFDSQNTKLSMVDGVPTVEVRCWRLGNRASLCDTLTLYHTGKRVISQVRLFEKIASGEYEFKGSSLEYDKKRKQWHVLLGYQRTSHVVPDLDREKVAYVYPGRKSPFLLRLPGERRRVWLQGAGWHIHSVRNRVFKGRRDRQSHYRHATRRRNRGRTAYDTWRERFRRVWTNLVKRVNHQVSHRAVKECLARGVGHLVLLRPKCAQIADRCFVSQGGSTSGVRSSWEFYQLSTKLKYKCQDAGIKFSEVEFDGSNSGAGESDTAVVAA